MGLSASQSRMLTLTARLSDLELKAQKTQEAKIRLAEQSTEASKAYMDALDAQNLKFNYYSSGSVNATVANITETGLYRIADGTGKSFVYVSEDSDELDTDGNPIKAGWYMVDVNNKYSKADGIEDKDMTDTKWLYDQLQMANLFIQKYDTDKCAWEDFSYTSSSLFTTEDDDSNVAQAEAEYEFAMAQIQEKDKRFDLDLDNINTEHSAVKTEMDSVKSVISDNVKSSFTIFS